MTEVTDESITIDELARRTGMTVRNIRAHQSRGLLPPPVVRGRTGYYGPDHIARVELIREMQADGFNLGAIAKLLEGAGGSGDEVLRFTRAVKEPFEDEEPRVIELRELQERMSTNDPELLRRAERLGIMRLLPEGYVEDLSPRLSRAGEELGKLGIPVSRQLDVVERIRHHADGVAREFVKLFVNEIWRPFEDAGAPEERLPEVREALERLRPLAAEAVLGVFQLAMTDAVEKEFTRTIERLRRKQRTK